MIFYLFWTLVFIGAIACTYLLSAADFRRRIIPDAYLVPLFLIGLLTVNFFPYWICSVSDSIIGATLGYALGTGIGFLFDYIEQKKSPKSPAPIGMGDIKLLTTGGIWLGTRGLAIALIFSCVFGCLWGICKKQHFIPFAPFFVIGAILSLIITAFLI